MGGPRMLAPLMAAAAGAVGAFVSVAVTVGADTGAPVDELAITGAVVTYSVVALVVAHARPGHRVARLMLFGASSWGLGEGMLALAIRGHLYAPGSVPGAEWWGVLGTVSRGVGWLVLIVAVPMVFPDGDLPWRRRWPAGVLLTGIVGFALASFLAPEPLEFRLEGMDNPTGLPLELRAVADFLALGSLAVCVVALGIAVTTLVHRWRSGDELRRQQLLWLCVAFAVPLLFLPLVATDFVEPWMFSVVTMPVPVAIAVAMLQRRLFDVQLAVSHTLTYLSLSAVVASLYALTVGGVGALLDERGASWLPWVAAGVVAVSFAPLRNALQQGVNRLTYGQWSQPADVLASTGRRLADAADVPALLDALVGELGAGLDLEHVAIHDRAGRLLSSHGAPSDGPAEELPLQAYGHRVGVLRWSGRRLREPQRRLIEDLANQLGGVVHGAGLLVAVREAQHRLVLAREEERRRLRRDLHDGLGPVLAGLSLQVDTLRNLHATSGNALDRDLLTVRSAVQSAVIDVRRIVEGLRPPALDELGLIGALSQLADGSHGAGPMIALDVAPLPEVPAAVEVAVYRIAAEAMSNAVRHACATQVRCRVGVAGHGLFLDVSDDGQGGAAPRVGGVGLGSMRERTEEIGGTLTVGSTPGRGTRVHAWLPLEQAAPERVDGTARQVPVPGGAP